MITLLTELTQEKADSDAKHDSLIAQMRTSAFEELSHREQTLIRQQATFTQAISDILDKRIKIAKRLSL